MDHKQKYLFGVMAGLVVAGGLALFLSGNWHIGKENPRQAAGTRGDQYTLNREAPRDEQPREERRVRREPDEFLLGICVGQNLNQQGITLPAQTVGQQQKLDDTTRAAVEAATESCRTDFYGTGVVGVPSPIPSDTSMPIPSLIPIPTDTSSPMPSPSASGGP